MRALVINLTRFGDLLQTQPVLLGLKAQGHEVGLLCLENFAPASALLEGVDYVATLPGGNLLARMDEDWRLALHSLQALLTSMRRDFALGQSDVVVNTTATLGARLLARQLAGQGADAARILGFGLDEEGFGVSGDMWATFLQGTSAERLNCPFNLVDMFRMAAGVGDVKSSAGLGLRRPPEAVLLTVEERLRLARPEGCAGFVAFQLGASESRRQWPVESFAALGARLWQELRLCPVLVGSPAERGLSASYAEASQAAHHPFIDCIGSTDIPHLGGVLVASRLLVSNDTGTLHLAAGLQVPVLGLYLSTAQPWDTGPYLPGCCCLEPALACHPCPFMQPCSESTAHCAQPCLGRISADTVYALAHGFLTEGCWPKLVQNEARVWRTDVDSHGFAMLTGLSGHEHEERSLWLRSQRYFYRHILDSLGRTEGEQPLASQGEIPATAGLSQDFRSTVVTTLRQTEDLLHLLDSQAQLARHMPEQAAQRLLGTCGRVTTVLSLCPPLRALGHLWQTLSQERGGDLETFLHMAGALRRALGLWRQNLE